MGQFSYLAWCCEHETELTCSTHLLTYHTMQTFYDLGGGKEGKRKEGREGREEEGKEEERGREGEEGGEEREREEREREGREGKRRGRERKKKGSKQWRKNNPKMLAIKKVYVYTPSPPSLTLHPSPSTPLLLCVP